MKSSYLSRLIILILLPSLVVFAPPESVPQKSCSEGWMIIGGATAATGGIVALTLLGGMATGFIGVNGFHYGTIVSKSGPAYLRTETKSYPTFHNDPVNPSMSYYSGVEEVTYSVNSPPSFVLRLSDGSEIAVLVSEESFRTYQVGDSYLAVPYLYRK